MMGIEGPNSSEKVDQRHPLLAKIAKTSAAVTAAVALTLAGEPSAEARFIHIPRFVKERVHRIMHKFDRPKVTVHKHESASAHKSAPHVSPKARESHEKHHKIHYQSFPDGKAKLEKIEGKKLEGLVGKSGAGEKFNPLMYSDILKIRKNCEFYDPWKSGIPLVKITPANLEQSVSRHFKVKDFVRIDPKDRNMVKSEYVQFHNGEYFHTVARIDPEIIRMLENVKSEMESKNRKKHDRRDVTIHTNEGFRSYGENAMTYWNECHGDKACTHEKSPHTAGMGVDIDRIPGLQEACLKIRDRRGVGGVGTHGATIVHLDSRRNKKVTWGYGK